MSATENHSIQFHRHHLEDMGRVRAYLVPDRQVVAKPYCPTAVPPVRA
ncbi:hypothetical protein [Streptomyces griseorubiginosus]